MILRIDGDLKPYYAQTLCMIFFPGVKFPENEVASPDIPEAYFHVVCEDNVAKARVRVSLGDKTETREGLCAAEAEIDLAKARQIAAGAAFYEAASALTGYRPPWGILTGVRPAKIASELIRYGYTPETAAKRISEKYLTTPRKSSLAVTVSQAEDRLIRPELRRTCSVYIGIPFCPSRCSYCSFVSYTSPKLLSLIPDYLTALQTNIHTVFETIRELGLKLSTVYIGGGTPTVLNESQLQFLLDAVNRETDVSQLEEFTLEAGRPDTITKEKLLIAKNMGVSRISVNTQTLNASILASIGRHHTAEQFLRAYDMAKEAQIPHINVDLIAGLTGESTQSFSSSVDRIIDLSPDNITVHTFSVKKAAEIRQENASVYDAEGIAAAQAVDYAQAALTDAGYAPYYMYRQKNTVGNLENVGFARPGTEGLYNIYMMEEVHSIFAAGASAVSKFVSPMEKDGNCRIERIFEAKYPYEYLEAYSESAAQEKMQAYRDFARSFYRENF